MSRQQKPKDMQLFYPQEQNQFANDTALKRQLGQIRDSANADTKYDYAQQSETRQFLREECRGNYGFNRLIPRSCPRSPSTVSHFGVTTAASIFGAVVMGGGASALAWHLGLFSFIARAAIPAAHTLAVSGVVGVGVGCNMSFIVC